MLAFYLHLRSSAKYAQRPALLQSHPILERLITLKQSLQTLEDLDFAVVDSENDDEDEYTGMGMDDMLADGETMWKFQPDEGLDSDELDDLLNDAQTPIAEMPRAKTEKPPKKKRKTQAEAESTIVEPVFDLVEPEFVSSKSSSIRHRTMDDALDAYGESTALHSVDAADKTARKKSLRFHTSKIESASARRQGARNQAAGGDDDIPYRERRKEKDARLVKEAAIRAKNEVGVPLDGEDPEPQAGQKRSRGDDGDDEGGESPDDYYELVKKRSKEEKAKKKGEYEEAHGRARSVIVPFMANSFLLIPGLEYHSTAMKAPALVHSQGLSSRTEVLPPIGQRAFVIPESRKGRNLRRPKRKFRPKKLFTRVDFPNLVVNTTARSRVSPKLLRVSDWASVVNFSIAFDDRIIVVQEIRYIHSNLFLDTGIYRHTQRQEMILDKILYHFGFRCLARKVFFPFAPRTDCRSSNFFFA